MSLPCVQASFDPVTDRVLIGLNESARDILGSSEDELTLTIEGFPTFHRRCFRLGVVVKANALLIEEVSAMERR